MMPLSPPVVLPPVCNLLPYPISTLCNCFLYSFVHTTTAFALSTLGGTTLYQHVFIISNLSHDFDMTEKVKFGILSANWIFPFLCSLSPKSAPKYLIVFHRLIPTTSSNVIPSWLNSNTLLFPLFTFNPHSPVW